jgi:hypothetical protein
MVAPVVLVTQEAEAGGLLEPRTAWETVITHFGKNKKCYLQI